MNERKDRRRQILKELTRLVAQLSKEFEGGSLVTQGSDEEPSREFRICAPKTLPNELQKHAARTAIRYNPLNAPVALSALNAVDSDDDVLPPARIAVEVKRYWGPSQRTLTVSFLESVTEGLRNKILSHLNAWNKTAGINFRSVASGGNVRITRAGRGYWSYVGTDILHIQANSPTMCLQAFTENTPESEYLRVVRHEAGHTLGFPHEHMRQELVARLDPQKCYDYFWRTQRWDRQAVNQQVLTPLDKMSIFATPPDQTSIMCYQLPGTITRDGQPIIGGLDINKTDYWFAGRIYPKADAQLSPGALLAALDDEERRAASPAAALTEVADTEFTEQALEV
jgi:hypothetical protein